MQDLHAGVRSQDRVARVGQSGKGAGCAALTSAPVNRLAIIAGARQPLLAQWRKALMFPAIAPVQQDPCERADDRSSAHLRTALISQGRHAIAPVPVISKSSPLKENGQSRPPLLSRRRDGQADAAQHGIVEIDAIRPNRVHSATRRHENRERIGQRHKTHCDESSGNVAGRFRRQGDGRTDALITAFPEKLGWLTMGYDVLYGQCQGVLGGRQLVGAEHRRQIERAFVHGSGCHTPAGQDVSRILCSYGHRRGSAMCSRLASAAIAGYAAAQTSIQPHMNPPPISPTALICALAAGLVGCVAAPEPPAAGGPPPALASADLDGNGVISHAEWQSAGAEIFAAIDDNRDDVARWREVLNGIHVIDRDQSGSITSDESLLVVESGDANGDGLVDAEELAGMAGPPLAYDTNGDGAVSLEEFERARRSMFEAMDANGDGHITVQEIGEDHRFSLPVF